MSELSISNVIRVAVQGVQRGVSIKNVNEVALFTPETPNNVKPYIICNSASEVADVYGTGSLTARMAQNIFAQNPNVLSGGGYLVVIPMKNAISGSEASFTSSNVNLQNFKEVNNGALKITANGVLYSAKGLNFTNASSLNDIATVIQNEFPAVSVKANGGAIVFGSRKIGADSSIVLSAGEDGTDISGEEYLNIAEGSSSQGADSTGEKLEDAIERVKGQISFVGVLTALEMEDAAVLSASNYINSQDMIYVEAFASKSALEGICKTIKNSTQNQTRCLLYTKGVEEAKLFAAAYVGRAFSVNFNGNLTSQTMNLKTLVNVVSDDGIDQTDYNTAREVGVDMYVSYEGDPAVVSNGANGYFDTVYENMALKFHVRYGLYNALKATGTKIPQTESSLASLTNALGNIFIRFVKNGVIAPGKWNSSQTFGNPETFRQNIENQGWYVYHTPIAEQAQSEREQRKAPYIQGACKRAGAIHEADILIVVEE